MKKSEFVFRRICRRDGIEYDDFRRQMSQISEMTLELMKTTEQLEPVELIYSIILRLLEEQKPLDPLWGEVYFAQLEEILALIQPPSPASPMTAVAVDPRDGDGWQDAVADQGTRIPYGDEYTYRRIGKS